MTTRKTKMSRKKKIQRRESRMRKKKNRSDDSLRGVWNEKVNEEKETERERDQGPAEMEWEVAERSFVDAMASRAGVAEMEREVA